jgi:DMSO reductase anchor subunit
MVSYIPVLTTLFSVFFLSRIVPHYRSKKSPYLLWWTLGVLTFGMGTLTESINAIFGWTEGNTKVWYIVGALLGGYPLAQGTIYLLMKKRFADISAVVCSAFILVAAVCVLSTPVEIPQGFDYRLTGRVFAWQWVRAFSPWLNLYAFVFLFGGAVYSAIQYFAKDSGRARFLGNILIAIGALLPGIGGSFTRFGYVEVLYITELIGLTSIYLGYSMMRKDQSTSLHTNQQGWDGSFPADRRAT